MMDPPTALCCPNTIQRAFQSIPIRLSDSATYPFYSLRRKRDRERMERDRRRLQLSLLQLINLTSLLFSTLSFGLPSHGCYWTESCQNKWIGGCGVGHVIIDQSDNCNGLCPESKYPSCLPFYAHFHCCNPESPKITDECLKCKNKVDYGDEYICCTDCSDPYLTDKNTKLGYCKTGAELGVQLKPKEVFNWVAGQWMKCSSPCDGGIRYRDVSCFGSIEDSVVQYPVDDSRCSQEEMPGSQEPCNLRSCEDFSYSNPSKNKHGGMSAWWITLLVLLGIIAISGLAFAGYAFYKRRTSTQSGFVYIMLEGYS